MNSYNKDRVQRIPGTYQEELEAARTRRDVLGIAHFQRRDCLIPVYISPRDLPIKQTRKNEIASLTLATTVLTNGIAISANSR